MNKVLVLFFIILAVILLGAGKTGAQELDDIITDRPDQTESAVTVPKGFIQVELGGSIEKTYEYVPGVTSIDTVKGYTHSYPSVLLRYGLSKRVELRFGIEYMQYKEKAKFDENMPGESGLSPVMIGTKISLFKENGARPETALLLGLNIPFKSNSPFQSKYVGVDFRFSMAHTLSERFALSYNLGGEWDGDNPHATGIYTLSLGISLINKLSVFVESYGFLPQGDVPDHRVDGGITYLIAKNIQADVSGGIGISDISPDYFVGLGISFRLPR
jgi:hypothetical protein